MINQDFNSQQNVLIAKGDYNSLLQLFISNQYSQVDLKVFYKNHNKKSPKILKSKAFWNSKLPHFHLEAIFHSDLKMDFIEGYFSSNDNCNHELNIHILSFDKSDFIKYFKFWNVFNYPAFLNSIKEISENDSELKRLLKEIEIIITSQNELLKEEKQDKLYIQQFKLEEIILAFVLYFYDFKQQDVITGNKKYQTQIEMALIHELNSIIFIFKSNKDSFSIFTTNDEIQKYIQKNEAPHHILGKQNSYSIEPTLQFLYEIINRLIDRNNRKGLIQLYLNGYAEFESVILKPAPLKTNLEYKRFKINNLKSVPEEFYFSRVNFKSSNPIPSKTDITKSIDLLNFYGFPEIIGSAGCSINISKVLKLLKYFSIYKGSVERLFMPDGKVMIMNQADDLFIEFFGSNESLTLFDYDKLINGISKYFEWSIDETNTILSFLSFDIRSNYYPKQWYHSPFIKFDGKVLWIGSFLKNRKWENVLLNKIKLEPEHAKLIEPPLPRRFELKVEELFISKKFKTICGVDFTSANGQKGDFDVLAYKDNYLFVCEAKTATRSDEFSHSVRTESIRLEGEAAWQLEKAILNIKEDWANIKIKLEIEENILVESLIIIPLIVTDIFEGDLQLYKNSIRKISLLELDVIFNNKKQNLLETYLLSQHFMNPMNPNFKSNGSLVTNWDLWNNQKELTVQSILNCIDKNLIWKEIETIWKFEDEKYVIG